MSATDPAYRSFVSYIDRTREYYSALGYERPYRWALHRDVPFAPLRKPLSESRLALITTASPMGRQGPKEVWSGPVASPPESLFTDDLSWDKGATHMKDVESFLPIRTLQALVDEGRVGALAERFHGVPTEYSQRRTREQDAPEVLARCFDDGAELALLVPI